LALRDFNSGLYFTTPPPTSFAGGADYHDFSTLKQNDYVLERDTPKPGVQTELKVTSKDKFFTGKIDRVERGEDNTVRLIDYKSALRDDVPERYQKQLQLYAYLWYETFGEWPIEAKLIYPFKNTEHTVLITPQICQEVAANYRAEIEKLVRQKEIASLANPSKVCEICEFRPWCKPFWHWQNQETNTMVARDRVAWGIEGVLQSISKASSTWKLELKWRNRLVSIFASQESFSHLKEAQPGITIRALGLTVLGNPAQPRFNATETSEIFLVTTLT
jgi:CRISPR/Cas system-associated exonuclease Cas4 (RecB family)